MPPISVVRFGPFSRGVSDGANPSNDLRGLLKRAVNGVFTGLDRLSAGPGTELAITLHDDVGQPVTTVCHIQQFFDGALAVAHSATREKVFLYYLRSEMDGTVAGGVSATAAPTATLWDSIAEPPVVTIAEGYGKAYIAHHVAADDSGAFWPTRIFDKETLAVTTLFAGSGDAYFSGVFSFMQTLWGWGWDPDAEEYKPELLAFSEPLFAEPLVFETFTVGHRVRSARERVIAVQQAGDVAYIGTNSQVWPIVGFDRDSWNKGRQLDDSYGFAGARATCSANGVCYWWSNRGPMRAAGIDQRVALNAAEPLWDGLPDLAGRIANPQNVVAVFDADRDQVLFIYETAGGGGTREFVAYDIRRERWLGPDSDMGVSIFCAAPVQPVFKALAPTPTPTAPPSDLVVSAKITSASFTWTPGDTGPDTGTQLELRRKGAAVWDEYPGIVLQPFTVRPLQSNKPYEWRMKHTRNGADSPYVDGPDFSTGPVTDALPKPFSTVISLQYQTSVVGVAFFADVLWVNVAEDGVSTEVWWAGPSEFPPNDDQYRLLGTVPAPRAFFTLDNFAPQGAPSGVERYWAKTRHVKPGSVPSPFDGPVSSDVPAPP